MRENLDADELIEVQVAQQKLLQMAVDLSAREGRPIHEVLEGLLFSLTLLSGEPYASRWFSLSLREQQVALLACRGYTNRRIAVRLSLSTETVKTHITHILHKLGVPHREQLRKAIQSIGFDLNALDQSQDLEQMESSQGIRTSGQ